MINLNRKYIRLDGECFMYAYFKGEIISIKEDSIILETNNIGYNILIPVNKIYEIGDVGDIIKIYTYTSVKEDSFNLFGFVSEDELEIFKLLITVSGVGPKSAMGLTAIMNPNQIVTAILTNDSKSISSAPGIGKKTAERLIVDLQDKVQKLNIGYSEDLFNTNSMNRSELSSQCLDAIAALIALGYSESSSKEAVIKANLEENAETEDILKIALKYII